MPTLWGVIVVGLAGLSGGSSVWPLKVIRKLQFEHWFLVAMFVLLIALPWSITLIFCPNAIEAYRQVDPQAILYANVCSLAWGVANILAGLCFLRIGVALTGGFLTSLGMTVGVLMPLVVKGSGQFDAAPGLATPSGRLLLVGVLIMGAAAVLVSLAGFGKDKALVKQKKQPQGFLVGLIMAAIAGITAAGMGLAFVYGQGPIVAAMKAQGAGEIPANMAVWAIGLLGAALINILYPVILIARNRSWHILLENPREVGLAAIQGAQGCLAVLLLGKGMLMLGVLGASVGFGIHCTMQTVGNQGLGFLSGEWRGIHGTPRRQMLGAIALVLLAAGVMAYANYISNH